MWDATGKARIIIQLADINGQFKQLHQCLKGQASIYLGKTQRLDFNANNQQVSVTLGRYLQEDFRDDALSLTLLDGDNKPTHFFAIEPKTIKLENIVDLGDVENIQFLAIDFDTADQIEEFEPVSVPKRNQINVKVVRPIGSFVADTIGQILVFELIVLPGTDMAEGVDTFVCLFQAGDRLAQRSISRLMETLAEIHTHLCPVPSIGWNDSMVSVEIVNTASWQTLHIEDFELLKALPNDVKIAEASCESIKVDNLDDLTCFIVTIESRIELRRTSTNVFNIAGLTHLLSSHTAMECGFESNSFQVVTNLSGVFDEHITLLQQCKISVADDKELAIITYPKYKSPIALMSPNRSLFLFKAIESAGEINTNFDEAFIIIDSHEAICQLLLDYDILCELSDIPKAVLTQAKFITIQLDDFAQQISLNNESAFNYDAQQVSHHHQGQISIASFSPQTLFLHHLQTDDSQEFDVKIELQTQLQPFYCHSEELGLLMVHESGVFKSTITLKNQHFMTNDIDIYFYDRSGKFLVMKTMKVARVPDVAVIEPDYIIVDEQQTFSLKIAFGSKDTNFFSLNEVNAVFKTGHEYKITPDFEFTKLPLIVSTTKMVPLILIVENQQIRTGLQLHVVSTGRLSITELSQSLIQGGVATRNIIVNVSDDNLLLLQPGNQLIALFYALQNYSAKETFRTSEVSRLNNYQASVDVPVGMPSGAYNICLEQGGREASKCASFTIVKTRVEQIERTQLSWNLQGVLEVEMESGLTGLNMHCELKHVESSDLSCTGSKLMQVEQHVQCGFDFQRDGCQAAFTKAAGLQITQLDLELNVYASDESHRKSSKVLVARQLGLFLVKPPILLSVHKDTSILIRQADSFTINFRMEHFVADQTLCWLEPGLSTNVFSKEGSENFHCTFTLSQLQLVYQTKVHLGLSNFQRDDIVWSAAALIDVTDCWFFANELLRSELQGSVEAPKIKFVPNHIFIGKPQSVLTVLKWEAPNHQLALTGQLDGLECSLQDSIHLINVKCYFVDSFLDKVVLDIPGRLSSFRHGSHFALQLTLHEYMSKRFDQAHHTLALYRTPEVDRFEPEYLSVSKVAQFVMIGRNFDGLAHQGQAIVCALGDDIQVRGHVLSSSLLACDLNAVIPITVSQEKSIYVNFRTGSGSVIEPYYTRLSNKLNLVNDLRLLSAKIRRVTIVKSEQAELLGSFKLLVRNGQQLMLKANSDDEPNYEIFCVFTRNKAQEYSGDVIRLKALAARTVTEIECEVPVIDDAMESDQLQLSLRVIQTISVEATQASEAQTYVIDSINKLSLMLVPLPTIISVSPQHIFNLLQFKTITVTGANFVESNTQDGDLLCLFIMDGHKSQAVAIFVSDETVVCHVSMAMTGVRNNASSLSVTVSNDAGRTQSNAVEIIFKRDLPRLTGVVRPELFFADFQPIDIIIEGKDLHAGMILSASSIDLAHDIYCNVTSSVLVQCYNFQFSRPGTYELSIALEQGRSIETNQLERRRLMQAEKKVKSNVQNRLVSRKSQVGSIRIKVQRPLIIKTLIVDAVETTIGDGSAKAIFQLEGIGDFIKENHSLQSLLLCEVYDDTSFLAYETELELIDAQVDLVACQARCTSSGSKFLDFKIVANADRSKRIAQEGLTSMTLRCIEPPANLQLVSSQFLVFYIDTEMASTGYENRNWITIQGLGIKHSHSQQPICHFHKGDKTFTTRGTVLPHSQASFDESRLTYIRCKLPMKQKGAYTLTYSQGSAVYAGLTSKAMTEHTVAGVVLHIVERPRILHLQQQLLKSLASVVTVDVSGDLVQSLEYECHFGNKVVGASFVSLDDDTAKTITCAVPVMEQDCFDVVVLDSHGRMFTHEDNNSTKDQVCLIQEIILTANEIHPQKKLPKSGVYEKIKLTLDNESVKILKAAENYIEKFQLLYSSASLSSDCVYQPEVAQMICDLPLANEIIDEMHFNLNLRVNGRKNEQLVYSLSKWLTLYTNAQIFEMKTSEPGIVFEGVDKEIKVTGQYLSLHTECFFLDVLSQKVFFRQMARQNPDRADEVYCALPHTHIMHNRGEFDMRLSLNGGHDYEDNPNGIAVRFSVVYAPQIESVTINQGMSNRQNINQIVVGRGEIRQLTFHGTYLKTSESRSPVCLFTQVRSSHLVTNDSQRLVSIYNTIATVISEFRIECQTPAELGDGYSLDSGSQQLQISLLLTSNQQEYMPKNAHKAINLVQWPVIKTISTQDEELSHRDTRLPVLEPIMPDKASRIFLIETDISLSKFEELSSYLVQVDVFCSDLNKRFRKFILSNQSFQLNSEDLTEIKTASGDMIDVTCEITLQESGRAESVVRPLTHAIVFVVNGFTQLAINAVDRERLLIGPWMNEYIITLSGDSLDLMTKHFKQAKCALIYIDTHGERLSTFISTHEVLHEASKVKCYFTDKEPRIHRQQLYCLEFVIGGTSLTSTCSQKMPLQHVPVIYKTVEQQDTANQYHFDTLIRGTSELGANKRTSDTKWLCYYFFFELASNDTVPYKINYARAGQLISNDERSVSCSLSDALQFYTQTHFAQTVGLTDLHSFFVEKSIKVQSSLQRDIRQEKGVFVLAHLLQIEDAFQSGDVYLYYPGDHITINGYFLDNSGRTSHVHLRFVSPEGAYAYSEACIKVEPTYVTCRLTLEMTLYGYLEISLVEKIEGAESALTYFKLSDSVTLLTIVLPKPTVTNQMASSYVTARTDIDEAKIYEIDFKIDVTFTPGLFDTFSDDVTDLAYLFTEQSFCRLNSITTTYEEVSLATITFSPSNFALQCHFTNYIYIKEAISCVEVSLNGGKTYSTGCLSKLTTVRIPIILNDAFTPLSSHVEDIVWIILSGQHFSTEQEYVCIFTTGTVTQQSVVEVLTSEEARCQTPVPSAYGVIGTHTLTVAVFHLPSGLEVHTFGRLFTYYAYLELTGVYPLFGSEQGGTPLRVSVKNLLTDMNLYEQPLRCRFSFDYSPPEVYDRYFYTNGEIVSSQLVICPTPDVKSLDLFDAQLMDYVDSYVIVSEIDGQFKRDQQTRFVFVKHQAIEYVEPNWEYFAQRNLVNIKLTSALPEPTLLVRMRTYANAHEFSWVVHQWTREEIFFIDQKTIVIRIPEVTELDMSSDRQVVVLEVSLNAYDWTTETTKAEYEFVPAPQITSLSHYQSNLRADFTLTIYGYQFRNDVELCVFGGKTTSPAVFIDSRTVQCRVPSVIGPKTLTVAMQTSNNFFINRRTFQLVFIDAMLTMELVPDVGPLEGDYPFTIFGDFIYVYEKGLQHLYWGEGEDIVDRVTSVKPDRIMGTVPASITSGRRLISIVSDLLTFWNPAVHFTYIEKPIVTRCWPYSGQSSGETQLTLEGTFFDNELLCYFGEPDSATLKIAPVFSNSTHVIFPMHEHAETEPRPIWLGLWDGTHFIDTGCTYFYYKDVVIDYLGPDHLSIYAHDNGVVVEIGGFNFREDDKLKHTLQARIEEHILTDQVEFVSDTFLKVIASNMPTEGDFPLWISNNIGISWQRSSSYIKLKYHLPPQVNFIDVDKIQVPLTSTDQDIIQMDVMFSGEYFPAPLPEPDQTTFYCIWGSNDTLPFYQTVWPAIRISSQMVRCLDVPIYESTLLEDSTYIDLQLSYNLQEYWGIQRILYYKKLRIDTITQHIFSQSQKRLVVGLEGINFMNTANITCKLENIASALLGVHISDHVVFESPTRVQCTFDLETEINAGLYRLSLSNNAIQFVTYKNGVVDVRQSIWIRDVYPKLLLTRGSQISNQHNIVVYAEHLRVGDQCFFRVNSTEKAGLTHQRKADDSMHSQGVLLNSTHIMCVLNYDLTRLGETSLLVSIGWPDQTNEPNDVKTASLSVAALRITDRCPNGYLCENYELHECPIGHYCHGDGYLQKARPCPLGYWQPKMSSQSCMPCLKGTYCERLAMFEPTQCNEGYLCDIQKLTSVREECTPGHYCPVGRDGNLLFEVGLYENLTYHCQIGVYCRGGMINPDETITPDDFGAIATDCGIGMVCHQGSLMTDGVGECPAGYFCPNRNHTGIECPPRHYCPSRGNISPLKCSKGTFNMHFGQKNCTECTLGHHCPAEGLLIPVRCPPGYVCNRESIVYPNEACRIGMICKGDISTGLRKIERSCQILETVGTDYPCQDGIMYTKQMSFNGWPSDQLPRYFDSKDTCCKKTEWVVEWFQQIGEAIGQKEIFQVYSEQIANNHLNQFNLFGKRIENIQPVDGMDLIRWFLEDVPPSADLGIKYMDKRHPKIIQTFIKQMYTVDGPQICPGGLLCIEGVGSEDEGEFYVTSVFQCPIGSYCLAGANTVIGSGLCPIGQFCPPQTEIPIVTPPGSYSGNYGATNYTLCQPGSFQLEYQQKKCDLCPAGYKCDNRGTDMPTICGVGEYRSVIEANRCLPCPKGTFSFERGTMDYLGCMECPRGRTCESEGLKNVTMTAPCTDGLVCFPGVGARQQIDCPEGYFCPEQTSDETMYSNQCMAGFFCRAGTGDASKTRDNCPQTYYCPPGTGVYDYNIVQTDYSNWRSDAPTRCPQGTGYDNQDTKTKLTECGIDVQYKMLISGINIRRQFDAEYQMETAKEEPPDPIDEAEMTEDSEQERRRRRLQASDKNNRVDTLTQKKQKHDLRRELRRKKAIELVQPQSIISIPSRDPRNLHREGRRLVVETASKDDPRLMDLYEIDFEIKRSKSSRNIESPIRAYLNVERKSIMRINPLNMTLIDQWEQIEFLDDEVAKNNLAPVIFNLDANNIMLVTMDLRSIMTTELNWVYGEDWAISITIEKELSLMTQEKPQMLPEQFLRPETLKNDIMEFQIIAWDYMKVRIDILIYNSLYLNHKYVFLNSTSVDIRKPNRANYGTQNSFIAILVEENFITLPFNQPPAQPSGLDYPLSIISFAKNYFDFEPVIHHTIKNRNLWVPSSLYWNQRPFLTMPYLPYFSNCHGYGDYIPIWALMEQNSQCELIQREQSIIMTEFSFGQKPLSDSCDEIIVQCVYDEIPMEAPPLPRWFEVEGGQTLFSITVDPVDYEEMMTKEFQDTEVIQIGPENGGGEEGFMPMNVILHLSYFQKTIDDKLLIVIGMDFDAIEEISLEQFEGKEPVYYNLTFTFESFSHKDLTIKFAFEAYFYLVLYNLMGITSIIFMGIFACFHRVVARPARNEGKEAKIAPCKFFTYYWLTVPQAFYGSMYAIIPVFIVDGLIAVFITGTVIEYDFSIFECDSIKREECILTFFDLMKDDSDKISVNYTDLRTGRCGTALFVTGAYLLYVGLLVLIPDTSDKRKIQEAYDGNIWKYFTWKRGNMVFNSLWMIFLTIIIINFSFSDMFGDLIWYMIILMKLFGIIVDWMLEKAMDQALLLGPLQITYGVVGGLVTFGADDFLGFIDAYFIEYAMMLFERTYLGNLAGSFFDYIGHEIPLKVAKARKWLTAEDDQNDWVRMDSDSGDSKIAFSDDDSFVQEENDSLVFVDRDLLNVNSQHASSHSSEQLSARFKDHDKIEENDKDAKSHGEFSYGHENDDQQSGAKPGSSTDPDDLLEEESEDAEEEFMEGDLIEQEVEPALGEFQGYANDNVSLFYSVFFVALLWVFYEETVVAKEYGIKQSDFIFYLYFQIVIVPFQIVVDITQLNLIEWYHQYPMHDYLDYLNFKFKNRKSRWKGNETQYNSAIDPNLQTIDQLCYSSQHYFVTTVYVSGMAQIIIGMQTLLWVPNYSCYSDQATLPIGLLTYLSCVLVHKMCIVFGRLVGIWRIDEVVEKVTETTDDNDDFSYLVSKIHTMVNEEVREVIEEVPEHLHFTSKNWHFADKIRMRDLQTKSDLKSDRVMAESFRQLFLTYNRPWLKENINEIFSPRTLFEHKNTIIDQFGMILGPLDPELSSENEQEQKVQKSIKDLVDNNDDEMAPLDTSEAEAIEEQGISIDLEDQNMVNAARAKLQAANIREKQLYEEHVQKVATMPSKLIVKYWLFRTRFLSKIRLQINDYIRSQLQTECQFCGIQYGLQVELMESLEDLFFAHLREVNEKVDSYKFFKWMLYFKHNSTYRTLCHDCHDKILRKYVAERQRIRRIEEKTQKEPQ